MAEGTKVGSIFYESSIDSKGVQSGADQINKSVKKVEGSFTALTPTIKSVGIALASVFAAQQIIGFFKDTVDAANQMQASMMGITTVANAFGQDADKAKEAAKSLAQDGLMSVREAADGLKNLLATGFSLPEAINLMNTFKDAAAFNRQGTLAYGEAIVGATQGIKNQNSIMVDNVGITKNLSNILKEAGLSQNDLNLVTSDATVRQKLYNGLLKEGSIFHGDAERAANTFAGQLARVQTAFFNLKADIGEALIPALSYLVDSLMGIGGAMDGVLIPIKVLSSALIGLVLLAREVGMALGAIFGGVYASVKYGIGTGVKVFKSGLADMVVEGAKAQEKLNQVWGAGTEKRTNFSKNGFAQESAASGAKSAKVMKDLEKETQKYEDETKKREKNFKQALANLIWAHQDKVVSLQKDLDKENKDFSQSMADRVKDFKESMAEMKADHEKEIAENQKELLDETADHETKVAEIQALIDKENSYGKNARQSKLREYQAQLAEEKKNFEEKSLAIQTKIDEENAKYDEQVAKAIARDAEETARLQEQHAQRVADTQAQLDSENAILAAHTTEVAMIKDQQRQDDIARLVQQNAEENAEAAKQHAQRMVDITNSGAAEGAAGGGAFMGAMDEKMKETKSLIDGATHDMAETMIENIATGALEAGKQLIKNFVNGIVDNAKSALKWAAKAGVLGPGAQLFEAISSFKDVGHFASGVRNFEGGMAVVGENGPELVNLPKGSNVYSNEESRGMGQNIYVTVERIESRQDMDALVRELGFRISQLPA